MKAIKIIYTSNNEDPRHSQLVKGLVSYNDSNGPLENWEWAAFYAEDDNGNLLGGIHCNFEWNYLAIKHLWVADRGKGIGSALLKEAEDLARRRHKKGVWLDTFEFQARGFYEKQGYKIFGEIPNAAGEYDRYFFYKQFDAPE